MLNEKGLTEIRNILREELKNYCGKEHIKLNISEKNLRRILTKNSRFVLDFELVKKLDLTGFRFINIDISGLDFTGSKGVKINPQTIRNKDMHLCKLNGVTLIGTLDDVLIVGTDFTNSKGAIINPQTIAYKNMSGAKLCDAKLIDEVKDVYIVGTNFTGCIGGATILADRVIDKDFRHTVLSGTNIVGSLDWAKLDYSNFSHSKGAIIDLQRTYNRTVEGAKLVDATIVGSTSGINIKNTIFYICDLSSYHKVSNEANELIKIIKDDFKK